MPTGMPHFTAANIIGNLLFSSIGYVAYTYGKKMNNIRVMIQGGTLMCFSYVVSDTFWMFATGIALTSWVYFTRND